MKEKIAQKNILRNNSWKLSKINDRHQTIVPGSSENSKQNKYEDNYI